jgi:hypothetical protein
MSEDEIPQKLRREGLKIILNACLEMAREKDIKDESVIYETFKKTAKKFGYNVTDKEVSRTIEEYKRMKKE